MGRFIVREYESNGQEVIAKHLDQPTYLTLPHGTFQQGWVGVYNDGEIETVSRPRTKKRDNHEH